MKYVVLVGDGMADYPIDELGGRTPLEAARTPCMDFLAQKGRLGLARTIPEKMTPASDVANLSILGYDPRVYYSGRGPLEAANLGVILGEDDVAFRCNLVTVSGDTLVDYSAGHISSEEASQLVIFLDKKLGTARIKFYPGVSYRHLMVIQHAADEHMDRLACKAPHDIIGQSIAKNFPKGDNADFLIRIMKEASVLMEGHEINQVRLDLKENPANMIWLWGQGKKPSMPLFKDKFGLTGSMISAVDLLKGLGRILGLEAINVSGATGYYDTDYAAKARAALESLEKRDFVFVHVEAPDEAGHNGDLREKIAAIERFDQLVVGTILEGFKRKKNFRIMVLPDHATPIAMRTHTVDKIPFALYGSDIPAGNASGYCEKEAQGSSLYFDKGHELMEYFIRGCAGVKA